MNFNDRVAESQDRLTQADRRVLDILLSSPVEAAFLRAEEVCARAGVHQASATRLAQRLQFDGYPEMRTALQEELLNQQGPADRVRNRLVHGGGDILQTYIDDEIGALAGLARHVSQQQLDSVADRLNAAHRVFLFGRGNAVVLVEMMNRRLRRFGIGTVELGGPGRDVAEQLLGLANDDVVLAFAFRRPPQLLENLLDHAAQRGASSILITDTLRTLRPAPDVLLAAPRGEGGGYQALTVPMAIANALVLTMAAKAPEKSLSALDRLAGLLQKFDR